MKQGTATLDKGTNTKSGESPCDNVDVKSTTQVNSGSSSCDYRGFKAPRDYSRDSPRIKGTQGRY